MSNAIMESTSLGARHDFDLLLPSAGIVVQPASDQELAALADMANRMVPGVRTTASDLEKYFTFDPQSILTFRHNNRLLGAVAFIYLNPRGHDALIHNQIVLAKPDFGLMAGRSDTVSAIYVRAIMGRGKAMAGLGNVSLHLTEPRLASADLYAQPSSHDGRNLMIALGFQRIRSRQPELWRYQRPWHRVSPTCRLHPI